MLIIANLVLQDAIERIFVGDIYGDIYAGIYVVRGENVVLLGEIVCLNYDDAYHRIWTRKTRNCHNVVSPVRKHEKHLIRKLKTESEKNGHKTEFFMGWYTPLINVIDSRVSL